MKVGVAIGVGIPKETWALISIMIYAFVIHMRLIPGLRSRFGFSVASVLAFGSIMMTYFGVNFYLAGLAFLRQR